MRSGLIILLCALSLSVFAQTPSVRVKIEADDEKAIGIEKQKVLNSLSLERIANGGSYGDENSDDVGQINKWSTKALLSRFTDDTQESLGAAFNQYTANVVLFCTPLILALAAISIGWNYWKTVVKGKLGMDWMHVSKVVLLLAWFFAFQYMMPAIERFTIGGVEVFYDKVIDKTEKQNTYLQFTILAHRQRGDLTDMEVQDVLSHARKHKGGSDLAYNIATLTRLKAKLADYKDANGTSNGADDISYFDMTAQLKRIGNRLVNLPTDFITVIVSILGVVVKWIVFFITYAMSKVMLVLGPLSLTMSMLGIWEDKWQIFLSRWMTMLGNYLTLIAIDGTLQLVMSTNTLMSEYGHEASSPDVSIGFNVIQIVLYIMSFWLTSMWIGSEDAGKVITEATGKAVQGIARLASAASGGGGAGGGGGDTGGGGGEAAAAGANIAGSKVGGNGS